MKEAPLKQRMFQSIGRVERLGGEVEEGKTWRWDG